MISTLKQMINSNQNILLKGIMLLFAFLAPFAVVSAYQRALPISTSVVVSGLTAAMLMLIWLASDKKRPIREVIKSPAIWIILAILIPAIFAVLAATYNLTVMQSVEFVQYYQSSMLRRILNGTIFVCIVLVFLLLLNRMTSKDLMVLGKSYTAGIYIFIFYGIWQFLHFLIGYPAPDFETRSAVHSVSSDVLINFRLTSLTEEPSFLVPFIIDGIIIGFLVYQNKIKYVWQLLLPALFVLFFSFSMSGYADIVLVGAFILWLMISLNYIPIKKFFISAAVLAVPLVMVVIWKWSLFMGLLMPIIGRFDGLFDVTSHSRLYMLVYPFVWLTDFSWVNTLFGFGPGSYEFLANTKFLSYGAKLSATSNNVFVDLAFEHGLLGGIAFLGVFVYFFIYLYRRRKLSSYYVYAVILWFHLGVTSLYRSDFVSPRFWLIVIITILCAELGRRSLSGKRNVSEDGRPFVRKVGEPS